MTLLHDYFNTRNLQAFQRLLDCGGTERAQVSARTPPSSAPSGSYTAKSSWTRSTGVTHNQKSAQYEVNAKDWLGRTVLHLACASLESIEYVKALLKQPHIDVNLPDTESQWTPLHRALYSANIPAVLLLLQRSDVDASLKDLEGYTAYDLYNSTLGGTKPDTGNSDAELFTWGANRNAALGVGDGDDRLHPEHIQIKFKADPTELIKMNLDVRFHNISVRQIRMSKFHTAVITSEKAGNIRVCGFGSGGRLGHGQHTQYLLKPIASLPIPIASVALGQDHTLALSKSGEIYSWGLNHFSQLGYTVEMTPGSLNRHDEPVQSVPKRVVGGLRKEVVRGVVASKKASACWTSDAVYTWGTNMGQLGYDRNAHPVQVYPRAVTKFTNAVASLAMSDTVLAGLLVTGQVECIWNDRQSRIVFPMHSFSPNFQPYRPLQAVKDAYVVSVTCCDDNFAALSSNGEVFTFTAPMEATAADARGSGSVFKPQKVWALRKKFSAVKDVALGSDGSIIICTESGHVYVRMRNPKASSIKAFKFERIPYLQRVVQVCANSTGAFGALRVAHRPTSVEVTGNTISQDLQVVQPYLTFYDRPNSQAPAPLVAEDELHDEEPEDVRIHADIQTLIGLLEVLAAEQHARKVSGGNINFDNIRLPHDADTMVHTSSGAVFPVHRVILAARSSSLETFLDRGVPLVDTTSKLKLRLMPSKPGPGLGVMKLTRLSVTGCHPLSLLIFLHYLYSDELLAVWDRRIDMPLMTRFASLSVNANEVKAELQAFARVLNLPSLAIALDAHVKREPTPTMVQDMTLLFERSQASTLSYLSVAPNVVIELADREVRTHSVVLRSRTSLFGSFFEQEDWTIRRWLPDGTIRINMTHMRWHSFRFVAAFMCGGREKEMFHVLEDVDSVQDLLRLMFEIASVANELLLDRLLLICASVILTHCNMHTACYILSEATYYHIPSLIEKLQDYISVNMESFLQSQLLDDLPYSLVKQLSRYVKTCQVEKSSFSRSTTFVSSLLDKHAAWLEQQDIPSPFVRRIAREPFKKDLSGTKVSPEMPTRPLPRNSSFSSPAKPSLSSVVPPSPIRRDVSSDDVFIMDEVDPFGHPTSSKPPNPPTTHPSPSMWKTMSNPRNDMKTIMAETQASIQSTSHERSKLNSLASSSSVVMPTTTAQQSLPKVASPSKWGIQPNNSTSTILPSNSMPSKKQMSMVSSPSHRQQPVGGLTASRSPQTTPVKSPSRPEAPGFGPTLTPSKRSSSKPATSSGKAWTTHVVQPTPKSPPATGMSFAEIQDSQRDQTMPDKDKRSLKEIQEEEQALQAEADFLMWWTAEEERVKQEAMALARFEGNLMDSRNHSEEANKTRKRRGANRKRNEGALSIGEGVSKSQPRSSGHGRRSGKGKEPQATST